MSGFRLSQWESALKCSISRPTLVHAEASPQASDPFVLVPDQGGVVPVVEPGSFRNNDLGKKRVVIIDSGASNNTLNDKRARKTLNRFICNSAFELEFDTANGPAKADEGVRVQMGFWDVPADYVCMEHSPELRSMGECCIRCMPLLVFTMIILAKCTGRSPNSR